MENKYPIGDWSKYIPVMTNIQDRTGIGIEWQKLWSEIENWYGDIKKRETGEQFLKRMQATYFVPTGAVWVKASERLPEIGEYVLIYNTESATLIGRLLHDDWVANFNDGEKPMGELTAVYWRRLPGAPRV